MYYTNVIDDKNKVLIQCNFFRNKYVKFSAVYDTGAQSTCITASSLSTKITEDEFKDSEVLYAGGLIDSENISVKYYKMHFMDFYIGNIHLTGVDIWVTFDDRVKDSVVGYDILRRITRLGIENSGMEIFFANTDEMISYVNDNVDMIRKMKTNIIKDSMTDEEINAYYVYTKLKNR